MKMPTGLSRQIVLSMGAVVLGVILLVILGSYAFYAALFNLWPSQAPVVGEWLPSKVEWLWMVLTTFAALALAVAVAIKLSRRILEPLTSVADSLRDLARGNLGVRAVAGDRSLGEAALLVDDFNVMAERLQRMTKEQLFWNAAIAHELRTPVTILQGRLQGLADGVFEANEQQFLNLLSQVKNLARLIEDLRVVGLADSGHLQLHLTDADISLEIDSLLQLLRPRLASAGLIPVVELDSEQVRCDPARIRQALLALLENARRHAVPGCIRIRGCERDGWYRLSVEDDGPGIADDLVAHVFDAFQRGNFSRSQDGAGSGLGLAVVRAIAQSHAGEAACRRSPKGGSIFELSWPAHSQ
ncbi:two-component system, OmpR family, sensor histidine kinase AdeS [Variovorax sp. OK212]|nr:MULTISPECIES: ATP-binding protein [unclassified Variovorax]SEK10681.1 two-component system, OmpR family, sensor histidine kinase AdeS [Variovorax sp. OK202]SFD69294.1 two-component system, OmpR family, sensor histidine kinase AdeS [Variovorax sp. OK212]